MSAKLGPGAVVVLPEGMDPDGAIRVFASTGVDLIAAERRRQVEQEGWTPEHDDQHGPGILASVAAFYCAPGRAKDLLEKFFPLTWNILWAKRKGFPTPTRRDLEKAGALIAAEIDRRLRIEMREAGASTSRLRRTGTGLSLLGDAPAAPASIPTPKSVKELVEAAFYLWVELTDGCSLDELNCAMDRLERALAPFGKR